MESRRMKDVYIFRDECLKDVLDKNNLFDSWIFISDSVIEYAKNTGWTYNGSSLKWESTGKAKHITSSELTISEHCEGWKLCTRFISNKTDYCIPVQKPEKILFIRTAGE